MVGTLQLRDAELSEHGLTLSAAEPTRSGARLHRLEWGRPGSGTGG
jgi:hypothetical protein